MHHYLTPQRYFIHHGTVRLGVISLGNPLHPTIVMLHGLRDTAVSLLPIARQLTQPTPEFNGFHVLLLELRGHGRSDHTESYTFPAMVLDLHHLMQAQTAPCFLFGHSLGGNLVCKYSALFPEHVRAVVAVEGLGPPDHTRPPDQALQHYRNMLLDRLAHGRKSKVLADTNEAITRLMRGNPALEQAHAQEFAPFLLRPAGNTQGFEWNFDTRANSVFVGSSREDEARFWAGVQAPACLVSGSLSWQYWGRQFSGAQRQHADWGRFDDQEMEARAAVFPDAEHHWFEASGHMVHYDEPARLGQLVRDFYHRHLNKTPD